MWTPEILCVTCRTLCPEKLTDQVEKLAAGGPDGIVLREKDLSGPEYLELACRVMEICRRRDVPCILHGFVREAIELGCDTIHVPLATLMDMSREEKNKFHVLGVSCHSMKDARRAQDLGATRLIAGNVFHTKSKAGVPGRGVDFLRHVCDSVHLPVFAIGGINSENIKMLENTGAAGVCVMSAAMTCDDACVLFESLRGEKKC